ncbi:hypothetical protein Ancab_028461 [Ancistrocladus abbreviatus]
MAGLDMTNAIGHGMGSFQPQTIPSEVVHDEHSATMLIEANKDLDEEVSPRNELASNDTMIQNLKRLDVENSSFDGQSITSAEPKHRRIFDDDKSTSKKKKSQDSCELIIGSNTWSHYDPWKLDYVPSKTGILHCCPRDDSTINLRPLRVLKTDHSCNNLTINNDKVSF